jgi:curved DNA-binding protein CbpA
LDATPQQIRQNYLKIAFLLHPDTSKTESSQTQAEASKLFSKFVNPAYEVLARDVSRTEHRLILNQTVRTVATKDHLTFTSAESQQLQAARHNLDLIYRQLLTPLSRNLYQNFSTVFAEIAQLSEYNLIFLLVKDTIPSPAPRQKPSVTTVVSPKRTVAPPSPGLAPESLPNGESPPRPSVEHRSPEGGESLTPFARSLHRAQVNYDRRHYDQAIAELREALRLSPKDPQAHCLLGMSYLQNKMLPMAKVHIKTAGELAPNDPMVITAKQELAQQTAANISHGNTPNQSSQGKFFTTLFGSKNK